MTSDAEITRRKADHLTINLIEDVLSTLTTGFEKYRFNYSALPEVSLEAVDTTCTFLGKDLEMPVLISSMTGGTAKAGELNRIFATVAEELGIALGVGSQRAAIENPDQAESFQVRRYAPTAAIFANLGAVQLNLGYGVAECQKAIDMVEADALILHLNPLQEALQVHGNTEFSNLLPKIEAVCKAIEIPVIIKEVGHGISGPVARRLVEAGVKAIDVAGAGGTSWTQVELYRHHNEFMRELAGSFRNWGIPTAECLVQIQEDTFSVPIIASGGMRDGFDLAKAMALGASLGGYAREFLFAAQGGEEGLSNRIKLIEAQLRIALYACGVNSVKDVNQAMISEV